ncbi:MAG TPA: peptidylprolyl isomerase [Clostridiales bacterium]|nr:peptidylprolyl isomerase [Clostridiales bacterium]
MKRIITILAILVGTIFIFTGCGKKEEPIAGNEYLSGKHNIEIEIEDYGTIKASLDADNAPITVTNFVKLVEEGFYDGLTFHRIITDFMIQGGDPEGNGTGGSDETIIGEFKSNGIDNSQSHTRGALSMARSLDKDSASSQFFIVHQDSTFLDGEYATFGYVTEGIEIVDQICEDTPVLDNNGTVDPANQPVITSIKVVK